MGNLNTGLTATQIQDAFYRALHDMTDTQIQELVLSAINNLDASSSGGTGKYIKEISETDGIISTTEGTVESEPAENSDNLITSGGVYPLKAALADIVDADYKENVLEPLSEGSTVGSEVQFAINQDGSITATCIAATTAARSINWYVTLPAGKWHFSTNQAQSGASPAPCFAYLYTNTTIARDYGDDKDFILNAATQVRCYLQIRSGQASGTTFTFYPMVCAQKWAALSEKYVPYSPYSGT